MTEIVLLLETVGFLVLQLHCFLTSVFGRQVSIWNKISSIIDKKYYICKSVSLLNRTEIVFISRNSHCPCRFC